MKEDCVFCKMIMGEIKPEIIWEDSCYMAFLDANPIMPGHTLLIPKKHTDYIFDIEDEEYKDFFITAKILAKKIKSKIKAKRIGIAVEGFGVPHAHIHLVPINEGHELNFLNAKCAKPEDLKEIADKLK